MPLLKRSNASADVFGIGKKLEHTLYLDIISCFYDSYLTFVVKFFSEEILTWHWHCRGTSFPTLASCQASSLSVNTASSSPMITPSPESSLLAFQCLLYFCNNIFGSTLLFGYCSCLLFLYTVWKYCLSSVLCVVLSVLQDFVVMKVKTWQKVLKKNFWINQNILVIKENYANI